MAKAKARELVTARGVALLGMIAAAGSLNLTQEEAGEIVANGQARIVEGATADEHGAVAVELTDAGRAALAPAQEAPKASNGFEIDTDVPMPTSKPARKGGGGRKDGYPFDVLQVGQSFHIAKSAQNEDPAARLASSVSGARAKYAEEIPNEFETVIVKEYAKNAAGEFIKDAEGKRVVSSTRQETRPKKRVVRDFMVVRVGADDPRGEGARVFRTA